jgi:hypothetical protein
VALQGTLDTFALPDVLRLLASTKKTGRLRISGSRGTGSVWVDAGQVVSTEATGVAKSQGPVDVVFELLRYRDGSFTFESDKAAPYPEPASDVEPLLIEAEQQLAEWRDIEAVVPSLDHWVMLVSDLPRPDVVVDAERWRAIVAVGSGNAVRRVGESLSMGEVAVSRQVKDLVELGLATVDTPQAPARVPDPFPTAAPEPLSAPAYDADGASDPVDAGRRAFEPLLHEPLVVDHAADAAASAPEQFAAATFATTAEPEPYRPAFGGPGPGPADGDGHRPFGLASGSDGDGHRPFGLASADGDGHRPFGLAPAEGEPARPAFGGSPMGDGDPYRPAFGGPPAGADVEPLRAAFGGSGTAAAEAEPFRPAFGGPGPADAEPLRPAFGGTPADGDRSGAFPPGPTRRTLGRSPAADGRPGDEADEVARQLATLSPKAARAVAAAARAETDEEREAALAEVAGETEEPINRGLLLKFLSSVRS